MQCGGGGHCCNSAPASCDPSRGGRATGCSRRLADDEAAPCVPPTWRIIGNPSTAADERRRRRLLRQQRRAAGFRSAQRGVEAAKVEAACFVSAALLRTQMSCRVCLERLVASGRLQQVAMLSFATLRWRQISATSARRAESKWASSCESGAARLAACLATSFCAKKLLQKLN